MPPLSFCYGMPKNHDFQKLHFSGYHQTRPPKKINFQKLYFSGCRRTRLTRNHDFQKLKSHACHTAKKLQFSKTIINRSRVSPEPRNRQTTKYTRPPEKRHREPTDAPETANQTRPEARIKMEKQPETMHNKKYRIHK